MERDVGAYTRDLSCPFVDKTSSKTPGQAKYHPLGKKKLKSSSLGIENG